MSAPSLLLVRMDVAHDREGTVNQMYEQEHLPPILEVPGVRRMTRYRQPAPTSPRYMTAVEVDSPAVIDSAAWRTAVDLGRWPREGRPLTMNRHTAMYTWVGGAPTLTHRTPFVFWVMMDVEPHREALFNELYDAEHIPLLLKLPGSASAVRYRTDAAGEPRYLAAYEVERLDLPMSTAWNDTSDIGRWKPEVRPYTYNKRFIVAERIWPRS
jgi:hypothetical protein